MLIDRNKLLVAAMPCVSTNNFNFIFMLNKVQLNITKVHPFVGGIIIDSHTLIIVVHCDP